MLTIFVEKTGILSNTKTTERICSVFGTFGKYVCLAASQRSKDLVIAAIEGNHFLLELVILILPVKV